MATDNPAVIKKLMKLVKKARTDLGDSNRPGKGQRKAGWVAKASPRLLKAATP